MKLEHYLILFIIIIIFTIPNYLFNKTIKKIEETESDDKSTLKDFYNLLITIVSNKGFYITTLGIPAIYFYNGNKYLLILLIFLICLFSYVISYRYTNLIEEMLDGSGLYDELEGKLIHCIDEILALNILIFVTEVIYILIKK